jgi:hypothetical protein
MLEAGYNAESYHVFIVRLWRERAASPQQTAVWRFGVEDPRTRQQHGFGSLEELMAFFQVRVKENAEKSQ